MSNYHKDDGSTFSGVLTVFCICLAFVAGYWVRDLGVRFTIDVPKQVPEVSK